MKQAATSTAVPHIVEQLRSAILSGAIPPNSRLVEIDLAERFAVSRGPIREALRKLEMQGLVILRPHRGAIVSSLSAEDVLEVYILRAALGDIAIRHLIGANLVTPAVVTLLTSLEQRAQRKSSRNNQAEMIECDLAFQTAVVEACGLPRVISRFRESTSEVLLFIATSGIVYPYVGPILSLHSELLAAVVAMDVEEAVRLWRSRMRTAVDEFLVLIPNGVSLREERPWVWKLL